MALNFVSVPVPLVNEDEGVVRVAGTRVTLETVIGSYRDGYTAEDIVNSYPSLQLADVYAVIGYYLRHREQVEAYLQERERKAAEVKSKVDAQSNQRFSREILQARAQRPNR